MQRAIRKALLLARALRAVSARDDATLRGARAGNALGQVRGARPGGGAWRSVGRWHGVKGTRNAAGF